jgi:hypothetical protein
MSAIKAQPIENVNIEGGRERCKKGEVRDRRKGMMGAHNCRKRASIRSYTKHRSPTHRYGYAREKRCPIGSRKDTRKGKGRGHCRRNNYELSPRRKYTFSRAREDQRLFQMNPFPTMYGGKDSPK